MIFLAIWLIKTKCYKYTAFTYPVIFIFHGYHPFFQHWISYPAYDLSVGWDAHTATTTGCEQPWIQTSDTNVNENQRTITWRAIPNSPRCTLITKQPVACHQYSQWPTASMLQPDLQGGLSAGDSPASLWLTLTQSGAANLSIIWERKCFISLYLYASRVHVWYLCNCRRCQISMTLCRRNCNELILLCT